MAQMLDDIQTMETALGRYVLQTYDSPSSNMKALQKNPAEQSETIL